MNKTPEFQQSPSYLQRAAAFRAAIDGLDVRITAQDLDAQISDGLEEQIRGMNALTTLVPNEMTQSVLDLLAELERDQEDQITFHIYLTCGNRGSLVAYLETAHALAKQHGAELDTTVPFAAQSTDWEEVIHSAEEVGVFTANIYFTFR